VGRAPPDLHRAVDFRECLHLLDGGLCVSGDGDTFHLMGSDPECSDDCRALNVVRFLGVAHVNFLALPLIAALLDNRIPTGAAVES